MNIKVASDGEISGFSYHDGAIVRIAFGEGNSIEFVVASVGGELTRISLKDVRYFVVNNLREGNTIDRLFIWGLHSVPDWVYQKISDGIGAPLKSLADAIDSRIFCLQCSFGAEVFAVVNSLPVANATIDPAT